jgi:hypothetical protein
MEILAYASGMLVCHLRPPGSNRASFKFEVLFKSRTPAPGRESVSDAGASCARKADVRVTFVDRKDIDESQSSHEPMQLRTREL